LDKYTSLKQDVTQKEKTLELKLASLNELKEELNFEQETVAKLATDKNKELVKYEASINENTNLSAKYSSKLEEQEDVIEGLLEAERIRIEAEQKAEEERRKKEEERLRLEAEKAAEAAKAANTGDTNDTSGSNNTSGNNGSLDSTYSGDFIWPVPTCGRITSTFGNREQPTAGASSYHKGIDIGASSGSEIVAAASGIVAISDYSVSAGNYIMLSHGNGIFTVYMHCSKLLVSVGDEVKQGEEIALVGSTGVSTGSHLHFGVSIDGVYVNPQDYVSY
jgi:murein DD-endopeptidase MepM/ murein hydrolase activator NlpD